MASGGSSSPSFMDTDSPEIFSIIAKYLNPTDLKNMRTMNSKWNRASKVALYKNGRNFKFIFRTVQNVIDFNEIFATSADDTLSHATFYFYILVLSSQDALPHLTTFGERFGHLVTKLTLNLNVNQRQGVNLSETKPTVESNLTLLFCKVKGQLVELRLDPYISLNPSVLGIDDFPSLQLVNINVTRQTDGAFIFALSQKIPAIQKFTYHSYFFKTSEDSNDFLANILKNTIEFNATVEISLGVYMSAGRSDWCTEDANEFIDKLAELPPRICELLLSIDVTGQREVLDKILNWVGNQTNCLKKLTFLDAWGYSGSPVSRPGLKLPSLGALQELVYHQWSTSTLINYDTENYFPQLRSVTTFFAGDDFTTPLPSVTKLQIIMTPVYGCGCFIRGQDGEEVERRLVAAFPNVRYFKCEDLFLRFLDVFKLRTITHLTIIPSDWGEVTESFWNTLAKATPKLTLQQILDLPIPSEPEVKRDLNGNVIRTFKDLPGLVELKVTFGSTIAANWKLRTLLYLSKTKQLQRLETLVFKLKTSNIEIEEAYIDELKNYHECVVVLP